MTVSAVPATSTGGLPAVRAPVGAAGLALAATAYVGLVDPNESGHYPTCPFLALTGRFCPGCGSLRAARNHCTTMASRITTYPAVMPR